MIGYDVNGPGGGGWGGWGGWSAGAVRADLRDWSGLGDTGWRHDGNRVREAAWETVDYVRDRVSGIVERVLRPVYEWVGRVVGRFLWVLETVRIVYPVYFERWHTAADERLCPECAPLAGMVWERGAGIHPPLHINCRCGRDLAWTEWRVRFTQEWRLRWTEWTEWSWQLIAWN